MEDDETTERVNTLLASLNGIIDFNESVEAGDLYTTFANKPKANCGKALATGAAWGGLFGAVKGLVKGCSTGLIMGFNPGSVAAGCMGGMLYGMVQGAVAGAIEEGIRCEITNRV